MLAHGMSAFLKIDRCAVCGKERPWEWVPPITVGAKTLAGTGVWRTTLSGDLCQACHEEASRKRTQQGRALMLRAKFVRCVGTVPYREFTIERYRVEAGNRTAFEQVKGFDPTNTNLYLWGPPGVGKTHLAVTIVRRWFDVGSTILVTAFQLVRRLRMKPPEEEQRVLDECANANVFVLDDLAAGCDSSFFRSVLREIIDRRAYRGRGGLVVTSLHSPAALGNRMADKSVSSRLAGMCRVMEIRALTTD
jgi:DNA replication protein DnaC